LPEVVQEGCLLRERRRVHDDEEGYVVVHCGFGVCGSTFFSDVRWLFCLIIEGAFYDAVGPVVLRSMREDTLPPNLETEGSTCGVSGTTVPCANPGNPIGSIPESRRRNNQS
jgi:hypothetical protein